MKKLWFLFASAALLLSCKKNFDANRYANPPEDALPGFLLYTGLSETATNNATNYLGLTRWMGYWARGGEFPNDEQTETYDIKNSYTDAEWKKIYRNLSTYDLLEKTARRLALPFHIGAAKLMKVYCFSTLVDLYNDIPYKEAFGETTKDHPAYDKGQDIYNDLVAQLDSAIIYFENARIYYRDHPAETAIADDQYDIMFGSAKSKVGGYSERLTLWEKLTNTVELKLLMHQSQVGAQQDFIQQELNALAKRKTAGFIEAGESASVNSGYGSSSGKINPFYGLFWNADGSNITVNASYYTANTYASDFYKKGQDARDGEFYASNESDFFSPYFGSPGDTSLWWGFGNNNDTIFVYYFPNDSVIVVLNGDTLHRTDFGPNYDGDPNAHSSFFSYGLSLGIGLIKGPDQDQFIFSDFESLFLQAEASARWPFFTTGNIAAQTLYESAITQNYIYLYKSKDAPYYDDAVANARTYFTQGKPDINWSASPNKLETILTQKWAAMNGIDWVEAYNDYRRTGYPTSNVLGISHALTHIQPMIPVRFLYPQSELNNNGAHVPQLGVNAQFTAKVFWDQ